MKKNSIKKALSAVISKMMAMPLFGFCKNSVHSLPDNKALDLSNMKLVFEDDFSGGLNRTIWQTSFDNPIRRGGYWADEQTFTENGKLIIRTEYKENGKYGPGWYTGTCLSKGKLDFTYGYFEVKCKAPAAEGLWSAFWMQCDNMANGDTNCGKNGAEIDIMESPYYNDPFLAAQTYRNTTTHTVHVDGYGRQHKSKNSGFFRVNNDMYKEFNTYGVLWTEKEYIFYINGTETWRTGFGVSRVPEYLWLSVEIAGGPDNANPDNTDNKFTWAGDIRNNPQAAFPADFIIDYIRVYQ